MNRPVMIPAAHTISCLVWLWLLSACHYSANKELKLRDTDGNSYRAKKFGESFWMTQNLSVTKNNTGDVVPFFYPGNDQNNRHAYGLLYDYETACKVCPEGWHLPSATEWTDLVKAAGMEGGDEMKDSLYWYTKNKTFNNATGFAARPAGYGGSGKFPLLFGTHAVFWSSSKADTHFVWGMVLAEEADSFRMAPQHPEYAFSVRCVRDY